MLRTSVKIVFAAVVAVALSGCGTINTVARHDSVTKRNLNYYGTYCESIPRVYSGVTYDYCKLDGRPNPNASVQAKYAIPTIVIDAAASGVMDTLVLPYTIYRQNRDGSIDIK